MRTGNQILAHIKGLIDMNNAELEAHIIVSPNHMAKISRDNELLKSLVLWIETPRQYDHDAFASSAMR